MRESYKLYIHAFMTLGFPLIMLLLLGAVVIDIGVHNSWRAALILLSFLLMSMGIGHSISTAPEEATRLLKAAAEAVRKEDQDDHR